jgi:hypothetical protein
MTYEKTYLIDLYLERVAIMIHDGGLDEKEAKSKAYYCILRLIGDQIMPVEIQRLAM